MTGCELGSKTARCWKVIKTVLRIALSALAGFAAVAEADDLARQVLIVYNEQEPESRLLADYYAQKRAVPTNQICAVSVRSVETITRAEYEHDIREPIQRFLTRNGLWAQQPRSEADGTPALATVDNKISYVVLMYGVPLRIEADPSTAVDPYSQDPQVQRQRQEASVDSELVLLPTVGAPVKGFSRNPFFGGAVTQFGPPLNQQMVLVGRLDGPDPQVVRRMIDDALEVERYGLHGRAYFDAQGTRDKGYMEGDDWIRTSDRLFREAGFECEFDEKPEMFGEDSPMTDVAVYAGWYTNSVSGPFRRDGFRFKTGAVAYHLHSESGVSVRSRNSYWVGPLLNVGAAATMGTVFEPTLSLSPHVDKFFKRLLDGATFLEAAYCAEPVLSWQTTFVGDPLYRPFGTSLDEQIARLEADDKPDVAWAYVRKINLLVQRSRLTEAEKLCRSKAEALNSPVLYEKLGDLLQVMHREPDAIEAYKNATLSPTDLYRYIRVAIKLAGAYEANKQPRLALVVYEELAHACEKQKTAVEYFRKAHDLAVASGDDAKAKSWQSKIDDAAGDSATRPPEKK